MEPVRPRSTPAPESPAYEDVLRRYRTLVEQLPLVIYVDALDAPSSNIFTSRQIEALLGYTVEEWRDDGDSLRAELLHPEDRDRVLDAHAQTHATHEPLTVEYRLMARDGHVVWIRDEGVVVSDDDGSAAVPAGLPARHHRRARGAGCSSASRRSTTR